MAVCTYPEAIERIKVKCADMGGQVALATAIGVSAPYLSAVLNGSKPIGPKITKFMGLEPLTIYKIVETE